MLRACRCYFLFFEKIKNSKNKKIMKVHIQCGFGWKIRKKSKKWYILDLCVSSLRRGHANLLCIVPILADDLFRGSACIQRCCFPRQPSAFQSGYADLLVLFFQVLKKIAKSSLKQRILRSQAGTVSSVLVREQPLCGDLLYSWSRGEK